MPPKRTSTSEAPAMNQAAIRKLVADSVAIALEAQATTMAHTNNPNRNSGLKRTPITRKCTYEKFMSSNLSTSMKYYPQTEIKKIEEAITMTQKLIEQEIRLSSYLSECVLITEN
nr:hypothetical protein [Tanacetum cinerariifolium]